MKRSDLTSILGEIEGVTDKHIKDILNLVHAETDPLKDERDELQKQLKESHDKTGAESSKWEKSYNELKAEFDGYKAEQVAKATKATKEAHLDELLESAKFSDEGKKIIKAIIRVDELEANKDGRIKDAESLIAKLSNEWAGYVTTENKGGSQTDHGNVNGGNGGTTMTKEEIMKIKDSSKRQQAIMDNPQLFGF